MNKKLIIPIVSVCAIVAVSYVFFLRPGKGDKDGSPSIIPTLTSSPTASSSAVPVPTPRPSTSTPDSIPVCRIGGEINFISPTMYANDGNYLEYENIKDGAQLIKWTMTPTDDAGIGPNMFAQLPLPTGETFVSVTFYSPPKYREYKITGKITYYAMENGVEKTLEKDCSGETLVKINY